MKNEPMSVQKKVAIGGASLFIIFVVIVGIAFSLRVTPEVHTDIVVHHADETITTPTPTPDTDTDVDTSGPPSDDNFAGDWVSPPFKGDELARVVDHGNTCYILSSPRSNAQVISCVKSD